MTYSAANTWVSNLNYAGYNDWRLPSANACSGFACPGSDMGHLFFTELGGVANQEIQIVHNANYDLFLNLLQTRKYWSGDQCMLPQAIDRASYSCYFTSTGFQDSDLKTTQKRVWAVRDGDVVQTGETPVPEPTPFLLLGTALAGLGWFRKRAKRANVVCVICHADKAHHLLLWVVRLFVLPLIGFCYSPVDTLYVTAIKLRIYF